MVGRGRGLGKKKRELGMERNSLSMLSSDWEGEKRGGSNVI